MVVTVEHVDAPNSIYTPYRLSLGDIFQGYIHASEIPITYPYPIMDGQELRSDTVALTFESAGDYVIYVGGDVSGFGSLGDPILIFHTDADTLGTPSTYDLSATKADFSGGNAQIVSVSQAGTYYFSVGTFGSQFGNYIVTSGQTFRGGLGSDHLLGGNGADYLSGAGGNDWLRGGNGNDFLTGGAGNDHLDGGGDLDTVFAPGLRNGYTLRLGDTIELIDRSGALGTDTLSNIEWLEFSDTNDLVDTFEISKFDGAPQVEGQDIVKFAEMYIAYFNRPPDAVGLAFWANDLTNDVPLQRIASLFFDQDETRAKYPEGTTNEEFIAEVYRNVLGREYDQEGFEFWSRDLNNGWAQREEFMLAILAGARAPHPPDASETLKRNKENDVIYLENKTDIGVYYSAIKGLSDPTRAAEVMQIYDGSTASKAAAKAEIDNIYATASQAEGGEFLLQMNGIVDDPFAL